jgi:hypothetical protein
VLGKINSVSGWLAVLGALFVFADPTLSFKWLVMAPLGVWFLTLPRGTWLLALLLGSR